MQAASSRTSDFLAGVPIAVDPGRIEKELAALWKPLSPEGPAPRDGKGAGKAGPADGAATRACLSNLIVFLPDEASRRQAGEVLPALGHRFPSRMLLLTRSAAAGGPHLAAWITAVCHLPRPGAPPICCEQITLEMARELSGSSLADLARGAVTPLLVPDLPVMVLFFTAPDEDVLSRLAKLVDRVVLDSRRQPLAGLARVARIAAGGGAADLEDLAWRETGRWRRLLCDFFDEASARPLLSEVKEVEVEHGGSVTTAALLAGWLASRLGWEMERSQSRSREVRAALRRGGGNVEVVLRETTVAGAAGAGIAGVSLRSGEGHEAPFVRLRLGEGAGLVRLEYSTREACVLPRSQPFRREDDAVLLGLALERPTPPQVFREALAMAARMV